MLLSILKLLLEWSPVLRDGLIRHNAEKHAREVVEAEQRAVALERLKLKDETLLERQLRIHAETQALEKELAELLVDDPPTGGK